jgi:hypothetical protein
LHESCFLPLSFRIKGPDAGTKIIFFIFAQSQHH